MFFITHMSKGTRVIASNMIFNYRHEAVQCMSTERKSAVHTFTPRNVLYYVIHEYLCKGELSYAAKALALAATGDWQYCKDHENTLDKGGQC